jgi:hypothetical protein
MTYHIGRAAGDPDGISIAPALATAAAVILALYCEALLGAKSPKRTTAWPTTATTTATSTSMRRCFLGTCVCLSRRYVTTED